MKVYKEIEQGSLEWYQIRYGKVGGSSSSQLHVKSDTLLNELVSCRMEPFDPDEADGFKSAAMERGNELEPEAREVLSVSTGVQFEEFGWLEMDECSIMGISPDGMTSDRRIGCEIKCPSRSTHARYVREDVLPLDYVDQVVQFFAVNDDLEEVWFCSYRPESVVHLFKVLVTRDSLVNSGTKAKPVMLPVSVYAMNKRVLGLQLAESVQLEYERIINNQF